MNQGMNVRQKRIPVKNPWLCRVVGNVGGLIGGASGRRAFHPLGADHLVQLKRGLQQFCIWEWGLWGFFLFPAPPPFLPRVTETVLGARRCASKHLCG